MIKDSDLYNVHAESAEIEKWSIVSTTEKNMLSTKGNYCLQTESNSTQLKVDVKKDLSNKKRRQIILRDSFL